MQETFQPLPPPGRYATVQCGDLLMLNIPPDGTWRLYTSTRTQQPKIVVVEVSGNGFEVKPLGGFLIP